MVVAFPHGEREVVQRDDVTVAAAQPLQLEHLGSPSPSSSPLPGYTPAGTIPAVPAAAVAPGADAGSSRGGRALSAGRGVAGRRPAQLRGGLRVAASRPCAALPLDRL